MLLLRKKSVQQIPEDDEIQNLVIRLKTEEDIEKIKEDIIIKLMFLCKRIARRYAVVYDKRYLIEDLICVGMLGLVKAVNTAKIKLKDNNIIGLVSMKIHSQILHYLKKELRIYGKKMLSKTYRENLIINHNEKLFEINDILDSIIKTDTEKKILELRKKSFTIQEIASILYISPTSVNTILKVIVKRLRRSKEYEGLLFE